MASKSKRRGRVFRASCILAALIIAGSSFAWFTSKDEVTNRLSANADYGVKIVESFAPPANWLPGQTVNKDVYATNTGSMPAFVKESVSTAMTVTTEKNTPALTDKSVELTGDQRYAVEAGSFLAYKPNGSTKVLGETVVARPGDKTETEKLTFDLNNTVIPGTTNGQYTDFVPDVEGLYVFRRVVNVNSDATEDFKTDGDYYGTDVTAATAADKKVGYDAYYFVPGATVDANKYYKVSNLSVVPDNTTDKADDNDRTDGILLYASAGFVEKEKVVLDPMDLKCVEYADADAAKAAGAPQGEAGKYLVASYDTGDSNKETEFKVAADLYDKAIHQLEYATILKDEALREQAEAKGAPGSGATAGTGYEGAKQTYDAALAALNGKTTALKTAKKEYEEALVAKNNAYEANEEAKKKYEDSMIKMYGKSDGGTTEDGTNGYVTTPETGKYTQYSLYGKMKASQKALNTYGSAYSDDTYFINELKAFVSDAAYTAKTDYPADAAAITAANMSQLQNADYPVSFYEEFQAWLAGKENSEAHGYYAAKAQYLIDEKNYKDEYAKCFGTVGTNNKDNAAADTYSYIYQGQNGQGTATGCTKKELADKENTLTDKSNTYLGTNGDGTGNGAIYEFNAAVKAYNDAYNDMMTKLGVKEEKDEQATNATTIFNAADTEKTRAETEYLKYVDALGAPGKLNDNAFGTAAANTLDIFIKLSDKVVCDPNDPASNDQWQHHPHDLVNYVADFYYTGILEGGETTSKLIDSVGLSTKADQTMYKDFDFDINVAMSSVQVAYDENKNITSVATPTELGAFGRLDGVKVGASTDYTKATDLETKVIWKDATPTA